jgi:hypothetical protein
MALQQSTNTEPGQEAELVLHRYVNTRLALTTGLFCWAFTLGFYS